jgi:hypothetical protein
MIVTGAWCLGRYWRRKILNRERAGSNGIGRPELYMRSPLWLEFLLELAGHCAGTGSPSRSIANSSSHITLFPHQCLRVSYNLGNGLSKFYTCNIFSYLNFTQTGLQIYTPAHATSDPYLCHRPQNFMIQTNRHVRTALGILTV